MKAAYRWLAWLIAIEVVLQAAFMAWALFGFGKWIDEGGVFNKALLECTENCAWNFTEERGFMFHGINGFMIVPLLSLLLLIVSFFAKVPGGWKWALTLFVLIVLQAMVLPELGREAPFFGAVHGVNALAIFSVAVIAGRRASERAPSDAERGLALDAA